ncbi:MAG: hypothetical protein WAQ32_00480 [Dethiobacteria bacterium]|jgi:hypothetical protein|nr:hypothetical protein [Bacillota bacterium]NMD33588.1 hypothetical protein [Bacillota bacterium]HOB28493.1 hypothetical protein [Bacillota bacterium]HPZ41079.1 hypothetical protein [Bacillota bacterium]HQD52171.1 hypothetical protein [Bacillota bacterium]
MDGQPGDLARDLDHLLEEGLQVAEALDRLEEELQRKLVCMDLPGLEAVVEARAEILRRGERFIERKRKLAAEKTIRELIERQEEDAGRSLKLARYELLREKLSAVKVRQEVNRRLVEGGSLVIPGWQDIWPGGKTTYNRRGEICSPAGSIRPGLDQNC